MNKNLPTLDDELRQIYELLATEVTIVTLKWQTAKDLFGHSKERVDLLNRTAVSFFHVCQTTFRDDTFVGLSKLTDPLKSAGKDNLCLDRLLEHLDRANHPQFSLQLEQRISVAKDLCKPFREWRHKKLAHFDLATAMKRSVESLPTVTIGEIANALKSVQEVINTFAKYFLDTSWYYEEVIQQAGVDSLAQYLERGERAFKEDQEKEMAAFMKTNAKES